MFSAKRGLSDVVTVSLIILLAIAAVVIVWTFVRPTLEGTGKQISSGNCLAVDLRPISCSLSQQNVILENGPGQINVDGIKIILYDANSNSVVRDTGCTSTTNQLTPLSRRTCGPNAVGGASTFYVNNAPPAPTDVVRVGVAAVLGDRICPASTETVTCT